MAWHGVAQRGMAWHGMARHGMPPQLPTPSCRQVKLVTTAERGSYSCRVFNLFHEVWSREVDVEIGEGPWAHLWGPPAVRGVPWPCSALP